MRASYVLVCLLSAICTAPAISATLEQLLPWLAPNTLELGTSYSAFLQTHPDAQNPLLSERPKEGPFNGEMVESSGTKSVWIYTFAKGELASIDWASSGNVAGTLEVVRNALIQAHGKPMIESAARVDSRGSIARIVREVYRPTIGKDCIICLVATSEGVEVNLSNLAIERKHGINSTRQTYEEAAKAISSVVPPSEKPSELVDYLAAERGKAETPPSNVPPQSPTTEPPTPSTPVPIATPLPSTPVATVLESPAPAPVVKRQSPVWLWLVGILAILGIAALALSRSRPS